MLFPVHFAVAEIPPVLLAPFGLLLLLIAAMPLMPARVKHWWERFYPLASLGLAAIVAGIYLARIPDGKAELLQTVSDYVSFICLIGSLFVVAGGIHLRIKSEATPMVFSDRSRAVATALLLRPSRSTCCTIPARLSGVVRAFLCMSACIGLRVSSWSNQTLSWPLHADNLLKHRT